jgi:hypothetical protein
MNMPSGSLITQRSSLKKLTDTKQPYIFKCGRSCRHFPHHSSLRSSLKNQIGLILASWVMSNPLGMLVPLGSNCTRSPGFVTEHHFPNPGCAIVEQMDDNVSEITQFVISAVQTTPSQSALAAETMNRRSCSPAFSSWLVLSVAVNIGRGKHISILWQSVHMISSKAVYLEI